MRQVKIFEKKSKKVGVITPPFVLYRFFLYICVSVETDFQKNGKFGTVIVLCNNVNIKQY